MAKPARTSALPLAFLMGVDDSGREIVELAPNGDIQIVYMGTCSFLPQLTPGRFNIRQVWLSSRSNRLPRLQPGPLVNYIADPDSHSITLAKAQKLIERLGNPLCFNPPHAVMRTRRDTLSRLLQGIAGVRMPRTVRIEARHPDEFAELARKEKLTYPLIVRLAGTHNGKTMLRIENPKEWDAIHALPWQGSAVYIAEFVDTKDPADGYYRKHRIVMVAGKPHLLHIYISPNWNVHRKVTLQTPEAFAEELTKIESFERNLLPRIAPVLKEIHRRIGLDYYGIDCHVGRDATLTIFEANAAMNALNPVPSQRERVRARIHAALERRLSRYVRRG